ncbi:D-Ala-D-Ala carboxypeptidase family metallohydrolase [Tenacibaculum agarivorans]|uniref:D-Ala-D-Ala carboxypeptidase family metallohydrolase n=1 Tax=Tenacibaculum agarivorans TaxID=1908389 RepID=UPI00094B8256|nr:D-Ala-D-Ala carboxypeptidase family metallohydrolase [Tenacibaculum agarivorans]
MTNDRLLFIEPPFISPQWDKKVTENFTLKEWYDSVMATSEQKEVLLQTGIPLDKRIPKVAQLVRDYTKQPVYIGSSYRTLEWDLSKGRTGTSQHIKGLAVDLNGKDVLQMIESSVNNRGELYQELKALGVNYFRFYDWGVHLDLRPDEGLSYDPSYKKKVVKKQNDSILVFVFLFFLFLFKKFK